MRSTSGPRAPFRIACPGYGGIPGEGGCGGTTGGGGETAPPLGGNATLSRIFQYTSYSLRQVAGPITPASVK